MHLLLALVSFVLLNVAPVDTPRPVVQDAPPTVNVAYGDLPAQRSNIYLPATETGPVPVVVLIHGTGVSKNYFTDTGVTQALTANNYAAVSIGYRLPTPGNLMATAYDMACALAWVHTAAETYNFDSSRIVLFGHSRGASVAALAAMLDDWTPLFPECDHTLPEDNGIRGAVVYGGSFGSPSVSFSEPTFLNAFMALSGMGRGQLTSILDELSAVPYTSWRPGTGLSERAQQFAEYLPLAWLDADDPPFLIVHGEQDNLIPVAESEVFAQLLEEAGAPGQLVILPGQYHRINIEALSEPLFDFLATVTATEPA
jgi:acetyl esterase/lipase